MKGGVKAALKSSEKPQRPINLHQNAKSTRARPKLNNIPVCKKNEEKARKVEKTCGCYGGYGAYEPIDLRGFGTMLSRDSKTRCFVL